MIPYFGIVELAISLGVAFLLSGKDRKATATGCTALFLTILSQLTMDSRMFAITAALIWLNAAVVVLALRNYVVSLLYGLSGLVYLLIIYDPSINTRFSFVHIISDLAYLIALFWLMITPAFIEFMKDGAHEIPQNKVTTDVKTTSSNDDSGADYPS